jgi:hypothetical protein
MLSLKKGRPIAKIIGGPDNNEILGVVTEDEMKSCCSKCSDKCYKKKCCNKCCKLKSQDEDSDYDSEEFNSESSSEDEEDETYFEVDNGKLMQLPNIESREIAYIAGPSGSGKSTYAADYAEYLKKIFPEKDLYVFSRKDDDPPLDKLKPIRIKIDESLVQNPIDLTKELSDGAIVIFDDVNTIIDDKQKKAVDKLMADIMEVGRSYGIYIIITNHLVIPSEKKIARTIMNELHTLTIFPKSGSAQQIRYALKTYFGLDRKQIELILKLPSRFVTISKSYPMYVLYDKGAFIL